MGAAAARIAARTEGGAMGAGVQETTTAPAEMTAASLAAMPPMRQRQLLGERLYPLVEAVEPQLAGKITGIILEMEQRAVLELIESHEALTAMVAGVKSALSDGRLQ